MENKQNGIHLQRKKNRKVSIFNHIKNFGFILSLCVVFSAQANEPDSVTSASATETEVHATAEHHEAVATDFNPSPMIMHHIADAHDFHVWGHFHIALPCIFYSPANGLKIFMSSAFRNHETHELTNEVEGYMIGHDGKVSRADGASFYDFSITKNVFTLFLAAAILLFVFLRIAKTYEKRQGLAPKGLQSVLEPLVVFVRDDIAKPGLGHNYERFLPYLMAVFFFILVLNLLGLIPIFPGGSNVTGNISVTLVLALITGILINFNGTKDYWKHIFAPPVPLPLYILMIPVEMIGVITKPVTLMIRLFANISAGHIIVLSLVSLIFIFGKYNPATNEVQSYGGSVFGIILSVAFTLFISVIELLVAFIQAFIFTMLSSVFIGMALEEHHAEHH